MAGLRDGRRPSAISTATVCLCVFAMFAVRLRSFNALEQELRRPMRWEGWVGGRKPSADTLRPALAVLSFAGLRQLLGAVNRLAWRCKAIHGRRGAIYRVVAVDGHELWASRARCCEHCLQREGTVGGERQVVPEEKRWIWVTDLSPEVGPATTIQRWEHAR